MAGLLVRMMHLGFLKKARAKWTIQALMYAGTKQANARGQPLGFE